MTSSGDIEKDEEPDIQQPEEEIPKWALWLAAVAFLVFLSVLGFTLLRTVLSSVPPAPSSKEDPKQRVLVFQPIQLRHVEPYPVIPEHPARKYTVMVRDWVLVNQLKTLYIIVGMVIALWLLRLIFAPAKKQNYRPGDRYRQQQLQRAGREPPPPLIRFLIVLSRAPGWMWRLVFVTIFISSFFAYYKFWWKPGVHKVTVEYRKEKPMSLSSHFWGFHYFSDILTAYEAESKKAASARRVAFLDDRLYLPDDRIPNPLKGTVVVGYPQIRVQKDDDVADKSSWEHVIKFDNDAPLDEIKIAEIGKRVKMVAGQRLFFNGVEVPSTVESVKLTRYYSDFLLTDRHPVAVITPDSRTFYCVFQNNSVPFAEIKDKLSRMLPELSGKYKEFTLKDSANALTDGDAINLPAILCPVVAKNASGTVNASVVGSTTVVGGTVNTGTAVGGTATPSVSTGAAAASTSAATGTIVNNWKSWLTSNWDTLKKRTFCCSTGNVPTVVPVATP